MKLKFILFICISIIFISGCVNEELRDKNNKAVEQYENNLITIKEISEENDKLYSDIEDLKENIKLKEIEIEFLSKRVEITIPSNKELNKETKESVKELKEFLNNYNVKADINLESRR